MTTTSDVRRITERKPVTEPGLASIYKVLRYLDDNLTGIMDEDWEVLGSVRYMLGQNRNQMDGVTYGEMRRYIREFAERHGV